MGPLIPIAIVAAAAGFLIFGKKKAPVYGPTSQASFPGGVNGELYGAYIAAITGHLDPTAYPILVGDLRSEGLEYEADTVAEYAMRMGPIWARDGYHPT